MLENAISMNPIGVAIGQIDRMDVADSDSHPGLAGQRRDRIGDRDGVVIDSDHDTCGTSRRGKVVQVCRGATAQIHDNAAFVNRQLC